MRSFVLLATVVVGMMLSGCSTLEVVPVPVESGVIDPAARSMTLSRDGITVTAAYEPIDLYSRTLTGVIAPFRVTVLNRTGSELPVDHESFLLLDEKNRQYHPLLPAKVKEMMTRDSYYLIPYPYVGFYYLEDYERSKFVTQESSNIPYYYEVNPHEIFARAFPPGPIVPDAQVSGLVYFAMDPAQHTGVRLLFSRKGEPRNAASPFLAIPFQIKK